MLMGISANININDDDDDVCGVVMKITWNIVIRTIKMKTMTIDR